ncbi:hypothetical protein ACFL5P_03505 [candidate division KSB1 bacterium]
MAYFFIGAAVTASLFLTNSYVKNNEIKVSWWQWALTFLGFAYTTFVLAVIVEFLFEGSVKGAVVMGTLMGFVAIVWGVLLKRFVFVRHAE